MSKTKEELIASVKAMAGKIENKGKTPEGKLSSEEFNDIQALIIELAENCSTRAELIRAIESLPFYTKTQILQMLEQKANAIAVAEALSQKQGVIADLDAIRAGAQKGMNALQPSEIAEWAKSPNKPTYTAEEVGALPANTPIPAADNEDLQNVNGVLKLADKTYNASAHSGLGRVYLRKNIVSNKNVLTQAMVNTANTIYHVQYDYDLNGQTITLPAGCELEFDGGSVKNGTIVGNGTQILASEYDVLFNNVTFDGTFNVENASICWFGATRSTTSVKNDISGAFTAAMAFPCGEVYVPRGLWYVGTTLQMNKFKQLKLEGVGSWVNLGSLVTDNQARLFTDLNISLLSVDGASISSSTGVFGITGGVFDISLAPQSYDKAVINIVNTLAGSSFACHKAVIETTITGTFSLSQLQRDATAINIELTGSGYIETLTTNCNIWQIGNGIHIIADNVDGRGWISDVFENSFIRAGKALHLEPFSSCRVSGKYQALVVYNTSANGETLSYLNCPRLEITGCYWDVSLSGSGAYSPQYAIEYGNNISMLLPTSQVYLYISRGWVKNAQVLDLYDNRLDKYQKYPDPQRYYGYNELNNFFVDNKEISGITIEAGGEDEGYAERVAFTNFDTIFSPYKKFNTLPTITYTLAEGEELHESDYVKITINLTSANQFGMFGFTHINNAFERVNVKFYNGSTLTYERERALHNVTYTASVRYDRVFFKDTNNFATKIEVTLINPLTTKDEIIDFIGLVKYDPSHYITSAGGNMHKPVLWDDKILINPQIYNAIADLPTASSYKPTSLCIFKDQLGDVQLGVNDGTYWRLVPLRYNTQLTFAGSNIGTFNKDTWYINTSSATLRTYIQSKGRWFDFDGSAAGVSRFGYAADRPTSANVCRNFLYFARDFGRPLFINQATGAYVFADGSDAGVLRSGASTDRPAAAKIYVGFQFFDTTLGKPIWYNGTGWVDATGTAV